MAKTSKKNDSNDSTARAAANPNTDIARGMFDAVVACEGKRDGRPARVALYGTRYGAVEVLGADGEWRINDEVGFGGIRAIAALRDYLDDADADAAQEAYNAEGDKLAAEGFFGPADAPSPATQAEADAAVGDAQVQTNESAAAELPDGDQSALDINAAIDARAKQDNPLATLDEVRAAYEAETRGACRPDVLRKLRVRAGEVALGIEPKVASKASKAKASAGEPASTRTTKVDVTGLIGAGIIAVGDQVALKDDPSRVETLNANGKTSNDVTLNKWAHECLGYRVNAYVAVVHVATGKTLDALRP